MKRALLIAVASLLACERSGPPAHTRSVFFANDVVATVEETVSGDRVVRVSRREGETVTLSARLDAAGFARSAVYERPGKRRLDLKDGLIVDDSGHTLTVSTPVILVELLHRVRVTRGSRATLIDLSSAEALPVTVERRGPDVVAVDAAGHVVARALPEGQRTGPGAFAEGDAPPGHPVLPVEVPVAGVKSLRGKALGGEARRTATPSTLLPSADHRLPGLFIESDDDAVRAFSRCSSTTPGGVLDDARRIGEAVNALVDADKTAEPPSARHMLQHGGDCDGAAALVTAALRACGHAARPVVGYKLVDGGTVAARLVPHAVVEVYAGVAAHANGWMRVDATVPALGDLDDVFVPVAEGLGGALTMGRVLGRIDAADLVDAGAAGKGPR